MSRIRAIIHSHGTISTGVYGVEFASERRRFIMLSRDISLDRLKELIREKLRLSPQEDITSIVYRLPINMINGAFIFSTMDVTDDDELEAVFDSHNSLGGQLQSLELYVEIVQSAVDINTRMLPDVAPVDNSNFICPPTVREIPAENVASSSVYRPEFDPSYFGGGMDNIGGCSMDQRPSHQTAGSDDDNEDCALRPDDLHSLSGSESLSDPDEDEEMDAFDDEMNDAPALRNNDVANDGAAASPAQAMRFQEYHPRAENFFNDVNFNSTRDPEFVNEMGDDRDLYVGKMFPTKEAFKQAVKLFTIKSGRDFKVYQSATRGEEYRCRYYLEDPHKCPWRIRAARYYATTHWTVTRLGGNHTCVCPPENQDHRKLDSDVIAAQIVGLVTDKPNIAVSQIQEVMLRQFRYHVSYRKAWKAKHKALKIAFGDWESSYAKLASFLEAARHFMEGTIVDIQTRPLDETSAKFSRAFWAFKPCIDAFPHLKPIVQVDGTWLYGKYKHTLLIACSQDGDRRIVPLAFAIVEGETGGAWKFFLSRLRRHVVGRERQGVCIISDRHPSIIEAVADQRCGWLPPYGHHVFCIRHIASNVQKQYNNRRLKKLVTNIGMLYVNKSSFVDVI